MAHRVMTDPSPILHDETEATQKTPASNPVVTAIKIGLICVGVLAAFVVVMSLITNIVRSVLGFAFGIVGGIATGVVDALNVHDFLPWYFDRQAQITTDFYAYCGGDAYCEAYKVGAKHGVDFWNELMRHKAARIIVAFAFPVIVGAVVKKILDELWESAKTKGK
jgi:hypothetical protein